MNGDILKMPVFAFFLAVLCLSSCIGVEFGYTDEGNGAPEGFGESDLKLELIWGQDDPDNAANRFPDFLSVGIARKINEIHYVWTVDKDCIPEGSDAPLSPAIRHGDYYASAFYVPEETFSVNGLDKFQSDNKFPMAALSATVPVVRQNDLAGKYGIASDEFSPEYPVVESVRPLWHASSAFSAVAGQSSVLSLSPEDITVELDCRINIQTVAGASVSAVTAVLTGVPSSVSLMTGEVSENNLGKAVFRMYEMQDRPGWYSGSVRTLGVFTSGYGSYLAGAGILWLAIDAVSGNTQRRLYAGLDVRNIIKSRGIMEKTGDNGKYRVVKNTAIIEVNEVLTIDGNKIVEGSGI